MSKSAIDLCQFAVFTGKSTDGIALDAGQEMIWLQFLGFRFVVSHVMYCYLCIPLSEGALAGNPVFGLLLLSRGCALQPWLAVFLRQADTDNIINERTRRYDLRRFHSHCHVRALHDGHPVWQD